MVFSEQLDGLRARFLDFGALRRYSDEFDISCRYLKWMRGICLNYVQIERSNERYKMKDTDESQGSGMSGAMSDKLPMTLLGKTRLDAELKRLIHEERPSVIKAIEEARAHGDISENAEYESAKERQGMIEGRIAEIQGRLALAEVIVPSEIKSDRIVFGATVKISDVEEDVESTYQIVGGDEADVKAGKISIMSPLARALIGKKKGEIVVVQSPKGEKEYEVLNFEYK